MLATHRTPSHAPQPSRASYQPRSSDDQNTTMQSTAPTSESSGVSFAQRSTGVPGTNGVLDEGVTCYRCNGTGHYACDRPVDHSAASSATTLLQRGLMLAQGHTGIDPSWILLDSQSTISVFQNADMLRNIRPSDHVHRAVTNGSFQESTLVGDFPNLGEVWFNPNSIANILSLSHVRKVCSVTMCTADELSMIVHRFDGSVWPICFLSDRARHACPPRRSYHAVHRARAEETVYFPGRGESQRCPPPVSAPWPAQRSRVHQVAGISFSHQLSRDCRRRSLCHHQYGTDVATLKGTTTRTGEAPRVPCFESVPVPPHISEHYRNVVLRVDFFVQGQTFIHTILRDIQFRTTTPVSNRTHDTIVAELRAVIALHQPRIYVHDIHGDQDFDCVRADFAPIHVETVAADTSVKIERSNRCDLVCKSLIKLKRSLQSQLKSIIRPVTVYLLSHGSYMRSRSL